MAKLHGDERLIRKLDELAEQARREILTDAMMDAGEVIEVAAKANAPVRTGHLRRSIHTAAKKSSRRYEAAVGVGPSYSRGSGHYAPYAHLVEYGHATPGDSTKKGAHPFMRPAFDSRKNAALRVAQSKILKHLLRYARRT